MSVFVPCCTVPAAFYCDRVLIFGILGAVGAVLYFRYTVSADPLFRLADWSTAAFDSLIYAAVGFVIGWIVGFAVGKIGGDGL